MLLSAAALPPVAPAAAESQPSGPDRIRVDQWHLRYLKVDEAHRLSQGDGIIVAVPDTGVDRHPDLRGNLLPGTDIISGGSGDGRQDRDSHGTAMAGLIAAHGRDDGTGALGIAPKAKILPIFASPPRGDGDPDALAEGIEYAILHGADVISISSVGGRSSRLTQAVDSALSANIIVVAGVGNRPRDQIVGYPASHPGVIGVGGVDETGEHASISVKGPEVDVVAPAVNIFSTSFDGNYSKATGTSDATAIVAGAAALIRSKYPYLPAQEVAHRLTATAIDKGPPGRDDEYGYGVIDLVAALTADVPPLGFESATASAPTTAAAEPAGGDGEDDGATARGLATLGVLVVAAGGYLLVRRRRRATDPPPRISR
ncbi:type VII secretion-associated serine protease mycosin [Micromonospora rhizosphaerae]|uniref:Type VII secretion-associated serine protease mycosin n=1 Tax=Micromonospora rhizosphaerae TaxID=568872 RepID=A0A1C6RP80_9ACTN|nr:type VII secretion-associated serine protease mycosin [Micromonospora rhizosphaerae]